MVWGAGGGGRGLFGGSDWKVGKVCLWGKGVWVCFLVMCIVFS